MIYDNSFSPKLRPFMIVSSPYVDLEGNVKTFPSGDIQRALFMVARVDDNGNVLAFKITSQRSKFINEYTYLISTKSHPFLRADSYIQLDKWHTLAASECAIVGKISPSLRMAILRKYDLITREVDTCLKNHMPWEEVKYTSPNIKESIVEDPKKSRLKYLQEKEKCCNIDRAELLELIQLEKELNVYAK